MRLYVFSNDIDPLDATLDDVVDTLYGTTHEECTQLFWDRYNSNDYWTSYAPPVA